MQKLGMKKYAKKPPVQAVFCNYYSYKGMRVKCGTPVARDTYTL